MVQLCLLPYLRGAKPSAVKEKAVQDPVVYGFGKTGPEHIVEN